MGLTKYSYKYLNWGYVFISIATLLRTLVSKSHEPLSSSRVGSLQPCAFLFPEG